MSKNIFITGTGTGVGKTLVAAIVAEAIGAGYWKPVQAGYENGTDSLWIRSVVSNPAIIVHPELHILQMPASPHIAAREEGKILSVEEIVRSVPKHNLPLLIEGAGGLMVPLNDKEFMMDLVKALDAEVVLVSRNYLGSINHSLLTASLCWHHGLRVTGWIFTDHYLDYTSEIVQWSGYPEIAAVPAAKKVDKIFVQETAAALRPQLMKVLC